MDSKIVFIRTSKGENELHGSGAVLSGDIRRALMMVDGTASFAEMQKHAAPSLRNHFESLINELQTKGYIQDKSKAPQMPKLAVPKRVVSAKGLRTPTNADDLDFTSVFAPPTPEVLAAEAAKAEAARKAAEAAAKPTAPLPPADVARQQALQAQQEREQAERRALAMAEEFRQRAEREATEKLQAELAAAKAKIAAEAQARAEAENRARQAAELRAHQEAEVLRLKARQVELEKAEKAALEAARKQMAEHEAAEREALERQAQDERIARELSERQARVMIERQTRELQERAERELQERLAREEAELRARLEREAREAAERQARQEREAREAIERQARELAEQQARELAARQARELAERQAREEAEQQAQREREARELAERQARELAEQQAHALALQQARELAERQAREEAERIAMQERAARELAEQQARELAEQQATQIRLNKAAQEQQAREMLDRQANELAAQQVRIEEEQRAKFAAAQQHNAAQGVASTGRMFALRHGADGERSDVSTRTLTVTVLFFDMVGYSKQSVHRQTLQKRLFNQLVSECLKELDEQETELIILDTGDGAAIGFMQHPEDALEVAMNFRRLVSTEADFAELRVRMGIHLGPVNIVNDMNGKPNMVGSGINDAQRVMDFSGTNQIFISRAYFDFVSRLSEEYEDLFAYRGIRKDKHGFEHSVYELVDPIERATIPVFTPSAQDPNKLRLAPVELANFAPPAEEKWADSPTAPPERQEITLPEVKEAAPPPITLFEDIQLAPMVPEDAPVTPPPAPPEPAPAPVHNDEHAQKLAQLQELEEKRRLAAQEIEAKKLAETQAKAWKRAEQRAQEAAKAQAEQAVRQEASPKVIRPKINTPVTPATTAATAPSAGRGWLIGIVLCLLLVLAAFVGPMLIPMQNYERQIEQSLGTQLQQPVRIARVEARLLPWPHLVLHELIIGRDNLTRIQQVKAEFALSALFSSVKEIRHLYVDGMQVSIGQLETVGQWTKSLSSHLNYPVVQMHFSNSRVEAEGFALQDVQGEVKFDPLGNLREGELRANRGGITLGLHSDAGGTGFSLYARAGELPFIPVWAYEEIRLKGVFAKGALIVNQLTGSQLGGFFSGRSNILWQGSWLVEGEIDANGQDMDRFNNFVNGDLRVKGRFKLQAQTFRELLNSFSFNGNFAINNGQFKGMDLVEILRSRGNGRSNGGRTPFEKLTGSVSCNSQICQFKQLEMKRAAMHAEGEVVLLPLQKNAAEREIAGNLSADLSTDAVPPLRLNLSGPPSRLSVTVQ